MKLYSFLRVVDTQPSPVIPLFSDGEGALHQQIIDDKDIIADFVRIEPPDTERLIIHVSNQQLHKHAGDPAIFSLEYRQKQVRFGARSVIRSAILEFTKSDIFTNHPFTLLEYALFLKEDSLIKAALIECKKSLETVSPSLFVKWLDGADIEAERKSLIANDDSTLDDFIHLSFSSTYSLLINLTRFSRGYLGQYRKVTLSKAVDDIIENGLDFLTQEKISLFFSIFLRSIRKEKENSDITSFMYRFFRSESRGNIKLTNRQYTRFISISENAIPNILKSSPKFEKRDYQLLNLFFFSNRSHLIVLIFYLYYIHKFNRFEEFIENKEFLPSLGELLDT